jgi:peptidoglycan/xylan/chitin deacetylase (PgdA/CDA1 family)
LKLIRAFSYGMRKVAGLAPASRWLRYMKRRRVVILNYHGVHREPLPIHNWCQMTVMEFEKQMEFLAAHYTPLPLSEVVQRIAARRSLPDHSACVTFDDGFRNVLTTAFPVLRRNGIPFTVFVVTGLAESGLPPWPEQVLQALIYSKEPSIEFEGRILPLASAMDREKAFSWIKLVLKQQKSNERQATQEKLMTRIGGGHTSLPLESSFAPLSWQDIEHLAQTGLAEIGSHTQTHEILTNCTPEEQRRQIRNSRSVLLDRLGYCKVLAYPNGNYSEEVIQLARSAGYEAAVSVRQILNREDADLFSLGRIDIGAERSMTSFKASLLGF